jgi:hypothetical protein
MISEEYSCYIDNSVCLRSYIRNVNVLIFLSDSFRSCAASLSPWSWLRVFSPRQIPLLAFPAAEILLVPSRSLFLSLFQWPLQALWPSSIFLTRFSVVVQHKILCLILIHVVRLLARFHNGALTAYDSGFRSSTPRHRRP